MRVPIEAIPFLLMPDERHLREAGPGTGRHEWVFRFVEDEDITVGAHGRN